MEAVLVASKEQKAKALADVKKDQRKGGRGGARPGAGRKSGSGAFGEATIPVRIPKSWEGSFQKLLDENKAKQAGLSASDLAPLIPKLMGASPMEISSGPGNGKPMDLPKELCPSPERCVVWIADEEAVEIGIRPGDLVVLERQSAKKSKKGLGAFWIDGSVRLGLVESDGLVGASCAKSLGSGASNWRLSEQEAAKAFIGRLVSFSRKLP